MFKVTTKITVLKRAGAIKPGTEVLHLKNNTNGTIRYGKDGVLLLEPTHNPDRPIKIGKNDDCEILVSYTEVFNDDNFRI